MVVTMNPSRRAVLAGASALVLTRCTHIARTGALQGDLAKLEASSGGRLGVAAFDLASNRLLGHRMGERFTMCSTFKLPLAAAVLQQVDRGALSLTQAIAYTKADLVAHAPAAEKNLEQGSMTISAMAEAAQTQSDNTAANLLLRQLGGPQALTQFFRSVGDETSRVDRYEPELNLWSPGELRDTTTPAAMARSVAAIFGPTVLSPASRALLIDWGRATETGKKRLRASLPADWRAGDKTGTAGVPLHDKYNDLAFGWPPGRQLLVIAAFFETAAPTDDMRDEDQAVLAEAGRIVARWVTSL